MRAPERAARGFTLIEIFVVLGIVAIIAGVALPTYGDHVRRARRAKAQAGLLQVAHQLEREASATGTYPTGALPKDLAQLAGDAYRITRDPGGDAIEAATRFTLRATPSGAQAKDACGTFTLSNTGERGLAGQHPRTKVADCWNR